MRYAHNPIALKIVKMGHRHHEPKKLILAALATGMVESHMRNLRYGTKDSAGWRQERKRYYAHPRNVRKSIRNFYNEANTDVPGGGSRRNLKRYKVGQIAQMIQQSDYPHRYQRHVGQALRLLRRINRTGSWADVGW